VARTIEIRRIELEQAYLSPETLYSVIDTRCNRTPAPLRDGPVAGKAVGPKPSKLRKRACELTRV
jgi:hypothetical protein